MQIGIVGKPSSGKSTFFSSATLIDVAIASYPFTTINPNKGIGFVRVEDAGKYFGVVSNPRHGFLVNDDLKNPIRYVPVELIDPPVMILPAVMLPAALTTVPELSPPVTLKLVPVAVPIFGVVRFALALTMILPLPSNAVVTPSTNALNTEPVKLIPA